MLPPYSRVFKSACLELKLLVIDVKTRLSCRMNVLVLGYVVFLALLCFCFRLQVFIHRDFYSKLTVN